MESKEPPSGVQVVREFTVTLVRPPPWGVHFKPGGRGPRVQRLEDLPGGIAGPLSRDGRVAAGDALKAIQNTRTSELTYDQIKHLLRDLAVHTSTQV